MVSFYILFHEYAVQIKQLIIFDWKPLVNNMMKNGEGNLPKHNEPE